MEAAGVPTARSARCFKLEDALDALAAASLPVVIKADGLAAGKGVVVAQRREEAEQAARSMLVEGAFGAAGQSILIEECLSGREVSVLALTDGVTIYPLLPSCDYKRAYDGDFGPNTGGMGAYAPVPLVDHAMMARIHSEILAPTVAELGRRGIAYRGVLYAGLMLTNAGPKIIEFNCRFGDPETEVVLPLLRDDLLPLLEATVRGALASVAEPRWGDGACVAVVLASGGYPLDYARGYEVHGLDRLPESVVAFHAGTTNDSMGRVVTSGGRVLALTARGRSFDAARDHVYEAVDLVTFQDREFRTDIAAREVQPS
jgi:phosphoribosylamine---glycine ligase